MTPDNSEETSYYDFCIVSFGRPTPLDKILFHAIGEGVRNEAIAILVNFLGFTLFYPGDFNDDMEQIMKIGTITHEDHIACYTTNVEEDNWKYMEPIEMERMLKYDIDQYHDARKRLIEAMKTYRALAERMTELARQAASGNISNP